MTTDHDWIVLAYTLPAEPSRKRVAVWRHLRKLGAVYLHEGVWFLPNTEHLAGALNQVVGEVEHHGGTASAFLANGLRADQKEHLQNRFNQERDNEYMDLRRHCDRFLAHVERWTKAANFSFSVVEELEEDLEKRVRLLAQIRERDVFGSPQRGALERLLEECQQTLAHYTEQVYERTGRR